MESEWHPERRSAIEAFRDRLTAHHLGIPPERLREEAGAGGSLLHVVEALPRQARGLEPLEVRPKQQPQRLEEFVRETELADMEKPMEIERLLDQLRSTEDAETKPLSLWKPLVVLTALVALAIAWRWTPLAGWISVEQLHRWAETAEQAGWTLWAVLAVYLIAGLVMLPVTFLVGTTAIVFGPMESVLYSLAGCLLSAALSYAIGRRLGRETVRKVAGGRLNRLSKRLAKRGVLTVVLVRLVPVAPFSVVNMVAGASHIAFRDYLIGTAVGMIPGIVLVTLFCDSLAGVMREPQWQDLAVVIGIGALLGLGSAWVRKRLTNHSPSGEAD